jgi:hypothetical protein
MVKFVKLVKADAPYKWKVILSTDEGRERTIKFGRQPYEDYTIHKDEGRKNNYISRHQKRENWTKSGIFTAGFWSRWLLWNKPTIKASLDDIKQRFF